VTDRLTTSHEFDGLDAGWIYYLCVYTVGEVEVACSSSVIVTIPPVEGNNYPNHPSEEGDAFGWVMILGLLIVMLTSISVANYLRYWRETKYKKSI
jgi:hypothetical protein